MQVCIPLSKPTGRMEVPPSGGWKAARTRTLESVRYVAQAFQAYVFSVLGAPVAQTWSLLYRRFLTCQLPLAINVLPITNRRYGRLKICATLNRHSRLRVGGAFQLRNGRPLATDLGGTFKQLKRVPRVEGGSNACEFGTQRRENAYFRTRSHADKFKSVTWKMRPNRQVERRCARPDARPTPNDSIFTHQTAVSSRGNSPAPTSTAARLS